jgi:hypothetical protein
MISRTGLSLLCALLAPAANAQWVTYPDSGVPRTRDGKVSLNAPAPRVNGKPDLSGVWHVIPTPYEELKRIFGPFVDVAAKLTVPGMELEVVNKYFVSVLADFKPNEAPMRPEGIAALRQRANHPMRVCLPAGPVAPYIPDPHKFLQTRHEVIILYEADGSHRQIYTDGRPFPKEFIQPSWQGFSIGKWEGDTLVVETAGFNDLTGLDLLGHPHSEALHVTERYHRRDFGHMDVEMTLDDPKFYTKPFTMKYTEALLPDTDVFEFVCNENEKDVVHSGKN